jgi:hypothetical protein
MGLKFNKSKVFVKFHEIVNQRDLVERSELNLPPHSFEFQKHGFFFFSRIALWKRFVSQISESVIVG